METCDSNLSKIKICHWSLYYCCDFVIYLHSSKLFLTHSTIIRIRESKCVLKTRLFYFMQQTLIAQTKYFFLQLKSLSEISPSQARSIVDLLNVYFLFDKIDLFRIEFTFNPVKNLFIVVFNSAIATICIEKDSFLFLKKQQ